MERIPGAPGRRGFHRAISTRFPCQGRQLGAPSLLSHGSQGPQRCQLQSSRGEETQALSTVCMTILKMNWADSPLWNTDGLTGSRCCHPSNTLVGLAPWSPALTLTSFSGVSGDRLTRRTGALWVLEQWPQGPLRGRFGSSQVGFFPLKVLTASPWPSSRCPHRLTSYPFACLWSLTCVTMPQRHKNKYHDCLKCHQVWRDTQRPMEAQASAAAAAEEECPFSPSSVPLGSPTELPWGWCSPKSSGSCASHHSFLGGFIDKIWWRCQEQGEERRSISLAAPCTES